MSSLKTDDGRLYVVSGASRSGKTAWVRKQIAKEKRVFVWDVEDQFSQLRGFKRVTGRAMLLTLAKRPGPVKVAFVASGELRDEFDFFCQAVRYAGQHVGPLVCVVEELADVTTTSKAPQQWGMMVRRGLKRGITMFAISQRWAEADKTAFGNASDYVVFRCSSGDDERYIQRKTGVTAPIAPLEFVKKDALTGDISTGKLRF